MSDEALSPAERAVADAIAQSRNRAATCAALVRLASQALARLTSHDQTASLLARLARGHAERAARIVRH